MASLEEHHTLMFEEEDILKMIESSYNIEIKDFIWVNGVRLIITKWGRP